MGQKITIDSLADFDYTHFNEHLSQIKDKTSKENYLNSVQRNFIKRKYNLLNEKVFRSSAVATSTCGNLDFEDGNTAGWTIAGDFQIMTGSGFDPYGGFPVVCPGGNFSLRVNDANTSCSGPNAKTNFISSASRSFSISPTNYNFKINWAGVLLDFPHPQNAAANVKIIFYDALNNPIPGLGDTVLYSSPPNSVTPTCYLNYGTSPTQGPQICSAVGSYPVSYFPWQQLKYNLSSYIGQIVTLKLSADWCLYNYDWAYGYFDICCDTTCPVPPLSSTLTSNSSSTITSNVCLSSGSNTLCSSTSTNVNYQWVGPSGPISTNTCIVISTTGVYTLTSNSVTNLNYTLCETYSVNLSPIVSFSLPSVICSSTYSLQLNGSPSGGFYSGPAVVNDVFYPSLYGTGICTIYYTYTDPVTNCYSQETQTIMVSSCTGIKSNNEIKDFLISPNPFKNELMINNNSTEGPEFILFNAIGQEILRKRMVTGKNTFETEGIPQGLYIYSIELQNRPIKQGKLVKD